MAQTGTTLPDGVVVVGPVLLGTSSFYVLGYNPKDKKVVVLGNISGKEIKE